VKKWEVLKERSGDFNHIHFPRLPNFVIPCDRCKFKR